MRVSAPGKLLLAGEYAVLLPGRSCLVAAVDRRLFVDSVSCPEWRISNGSDAWSGGQAPESLAFAVAALLAARPAGAAPRALTTSDEQHAGGLKLGLGGSAAVTVAAAFAASGHGADRDALWRLCDRVHRATQGGRGSGADVAASLHGGVLRYSREPLAARRVALHPDLRLVAVWTGASSKTAPRLARFQAFVADRPEDARRFAEASEAVVEALESSLAEGDGARMVAAVAEARAVLHGLERALGLELETAPLARAAEVAARAGACAKLSGAGGGDCAVAFALGDDGAARLIDALSAEGLPAFPMPVAEEGVRVEPG